MALILSLRVGEAFYCNDNRVEVADVKGPGHFVLTTKDAGFEIFDNRSEEVLPDVRVSSGNKGTREQASIVIEAPRDITILRDKVRKADHEGP